MCAGYITACRISVHLFTSYSLIAAVGLAEDNAVVISAGILFSPLQVCTDCDAREFCIQSPNVHVLFL
jgi:hypothetical protein